MRDLECAAFWVLKLRVDFELAAICANCEAREVAMAAALQDSWSREGELNAAWLVFGNQSCGGQK